MDGPFKTQLPTSKTLRNATLFDEQQTSMKRNSGHLTLFVIKRIYSSCPLSEISASITQRKSTIST